MIETLTPDLCVIGAGSGGLSVASGAAQMGADVVLIERDKMGGDCLNNGCVPSKSLLAAGHAAAAVRGAGRFGVNGHDKGGSRKVHECHAANHPAICIPCRRLAEMRVEDNGNAKASGHLTYGLQHSANIAVGVRVRTLAEVT